MSLIIRSVFCLALLIPSAVQAQMADRTMTSTIDAVVVSVDPGTREVVLENTETGERQFAIAGPDVQNFGQISVGDQVRAQLTLGLTARMAFPDETDSKARLEGQAKEGEKPGRIDAASVTRVLELVDYNAETFVAVVRDQNGLIRSLFVRSPEGREFAAQLAVGDRVAVTYSETVAIGIIED